MDHHDHVELLRGGVAPGVSLGVAPADSPDAPPAEASARGPRPTAWADLGAGEGAFTLALADLLGPGATIHAVDRDGQALERNARDMERRFPGTHLVTHRNDFTAGVPVEEGSLDGIVMANSLHFVRDKAPVLSVVLTALRPGGTFVLVEYGADSGNPWVPWPLSYPTWERLAAAAGLTATRRIGQVPSRFLGSIYSAASRLPDDAPGGPRFE